MAPPHSSPLPTPTTPARRPRRPSTRDIAVLVSGRGSNLEAILRSIERGEIRGARVRVVLSDREGARALRLAERRGIGAVWLDPSRAAGRAEYGAQILSALRERGVTPETGIVLLAGFMRVLSREFVDSFPGRILNIHPSLLPAFPGLDAQAQAIAHGAKVSGCTVHFVLPEVDAGPIVMQRAVPVRDGDTAETLAARILRQEHRIYPVAVKLLVEGRLKIEGRRVVVEAR